MTWPLLTYNGTHAVGIIDTNSTKSALLYDNIHVNGYEMNGHMSAFISNELALRGIPIQSAVAIMDKYINGDVCESDHR